MLKNGIKINVAISFLVIFTILATTIMNLYLSSKAIEETLTDNFLETNYQYAKKVSLSTNNAIQIIQQNLSVLAEIIGNEEFTQKDLDYWYASNESYFNSLFTTNEDGIVQLISPLAIPNNQQGVKPGTKIETALMKKALKEKKPFISDPYLAQTGNLMILISQPIFDSDGNYKGVVDGTLYLGRDNIIEKVLNQHVFQNESTLFVVDRLGQIIYHPDSNRILESIAENPLIQDVMNGNEGSRQIKIIEGQSTFPAMHMKRILDGALLLKHQLR